MFIYMYNPFLGITPLSLKVLLEYTNRTSTMSLRQDLMTSSWYKPFILLESLRFHHTLCGPGLHLWKAYNMSDNYDRCFIILL